ncbi:hypothetical protein 2 [Changjiang tombus-like virus 18]|uniref:hypothetical protein 2 n=1 Tax=Changjiang tombus-like virus 18 TaxID=1922811 RepID=UPI00090B3A60|nr:hypothetical protein 2 [Changjiang tombus-like virus 18]APG76222.1 hypothetical protein 2 [Changjiang tombus-like virus 18]
MSRQYRSVCGGIKQMGYTDIIRNTRTGLRKRYRRAFSNLWDRRMEYDPRFARISAFVKYEKMDISKLHEGKPPRLIQFRSYEYTYLLKSFILNHSLAIKTNSIYFNNQPVDTIFSKIHDSFGVARILRENWEQFSEPVAICLDHSKFDGHYNTTLLELEHSYWRSLSSSRILKLLLKDQLSNKCITANNIKYKSRGSRCSGEYTTSEGNTLMNYAMLSSWLKFSGITDFRITVNGDDSVVFIERKDQTKLADLSFFRNFNMETECDRIAEDFREISFCQASPIRISKEGQPTWFMVKEPFRAITRATYADYKHRQCIDRLLTAQGLCEIAVNSGVPMLQEFALLLMSYGSLKPLGSIDKMPAKTSGRWLSSYVDIPDYTRSDFEIAFGVSKAEQQFIENSFAGQLRQPKSKILQTLLKYQNFIKN